MSPRADGEYRRGHPYVLPGGKALLFRYGENSWDLEETRLAVLSLDSGETRVLLEGASRPSYTPSGHLVYNQLGRLMAAPFDPDRGVFTGAAVEVTESRMVSPDPAWAISAAGVLVYSPAESDSARSLIPVWVDRGGREESSSLPPIQESAWARVSPDGRRAVLHAIQGPVISDVWVYTLGSGTRTRLSDGPEWETAPIWTADGERVVFGSLDADVFDMFWTFANGTGSVERLTGGARHQIPHSMSPENGKSCLVRRRRVPFLPASTS